MKSKLEYIPKHKRKKILLMCDDIRMHSGVANVGKDLVIHLAHRYNWLNIGGAINHPDAGKKLDISQETNKITGIEDAEVFFNCVEVCSILIDRLCVHYKSASLSLFFW